MLCLPISSTTRCLIHRSPISSRCSILKSMMRSSPGCVISTILPLLICFLKSIQKPGAVRGAGLFNDVIYTSGRLGLAHMSSLFWPVDPFMVRMSSSFSVCAILLILPPERMFFNSYVSACTVIPSNAITITSEIYFYNERSIS